MKKLLEVKVTNTYLAQDQIFQAVDQEGVKLGGKDLVYGVVIQDHPEAIGSTLPLAFDNALVTAGITKTKYNKQPSAQVNVYEITHNDRRPIWTDVIY